MVRLAGHDYKPGTNPSPQLLLAARMSVGHTQSQAAQTLRWKSYKSWQQCELGKAAMSPTAFELYCVKTGLWPDG